MRQWFYYGGKSSKDYGVYISGTNTFGAAERDQETISIPGRNGDLTLDHGRYKNISLVYPAFIYRDFGVNISALRNFLLSRKSYKRLEDTYHPDEYRLAKYVGEFSTEVMDNLKHGKFELTFDCYPQRFLKSGEKKITFTTAGSILNTYDQTALPLVRAYGDGTLTINGISIVISGSSTYTDIDCDLQEAYKDDLSVSKNSTITLTDGEFFSLAPGSNSISFSGISKVEIAPRWWIL